jgi:5-methylcytosine-specific restriction enzyme A
MSTPRKEFTKATRRAAWERCGGRCEGLIIWWSGVCSRFGDRCLAPIDIGCFHYDHIDNVWTSQNNSLENCQVLCIPCHKAKTRRDVKQIAKTKRIIDKRLKLRSSRTPMPFGKGDWRKRKMDGTVVDRRTGRPVSQKGTIANGRQASRPR